MLFTTTLGASAGELRRTSVWRTAIEGLVSSPIPFPSAERPDSVVVTTGSGRVLRLDAKGEVVFDYAMGDATNAAPAVADVDGDGAVEIVAGTIRGHIVCLTGDGRLKWSQEVRARFMDFACVVLAPRAGGCDVLINSQDGWLTCLDGNGRRRWRFKAEAYRICAPAAADLDGDGACEFVAGCDAHRVIAITSDGRLMWEFAYRANLGRSLAVVADANRDGTPEVYINQSSPPGESHVYCLDAPSGRLLWAAPIAFQGYCDLAVADINGDGFDEILAADKSTTLYAFSHAGERLWERSMGGNGIFFNPAVADIDGDGALEIVIGVRDAGSDGNSLYVLDTQGNVLGGYPQEGSANAAAAVADFDGDGRLEVISQSGGAVFAYRFGSPTQAGAVLWPCHRGSPALAGSLLPTRAGKATGKPAPRGVLLPKTFAPLLGDTPLTAAWNVPTPAQGRVEVSVADERGVRITQAFRTSPDAQSVQVLVPFRHAGRCIVEARLMDTAKNQTLLEDTREIIFEPLAAEREMAEAAARGFASGAAAIVSASPQMAAELERRRASLTAQVAAVRAQTAAVPAEAEFPQELVEAAAALRAATGRDAAVADLTQKVSANAPGALFVAWHDANPWDDADPRDELPDTASDQYTFSAWAYGGQREDLALNLVGLGAEPVTVRVEPEDLAGPDGAKAPWEKHLALCDVVWMPAALDGWVADMLPAMNAGRTLQLAPGSFAQLWMVVNTDGLAAGEWTVNLRLQSLTYSAVAVDVALRLEVLPVALPFPYPWKLCNWVQPARYPESVRDQVIENLVTHGVSVYYNSAPARRCDAEGNLVGEVDWSQHDELVRKTKAADPVFFYNGLTLEAPAGVGPDAPTWKKAYKAWMQEFVSHLSSVGVDYRHFVFYPVDEPGLTGQTSVDRLINAARQFREADPKAPVYANPAGGVSLDTIREMDPWVDVWQPELALMKRFGRALLEIISTRNRRVWCYEAPGDVRVLKPLGFYRMQPWVALRCGLQGSGYWTYQYQDLWGVAKTEPDYGTVNVDRTSVVNSRRWRASHDGVQDVTAVIVLDQAITEAEKAGVDPALVGTAKAARAAAVAEVTAGQENLGPISIMFSDYAVEFNLLQRHRRAVADMTVALCAALAAKKA